MEGLAWQGLPLFGWGLRGAPGLCVIGREGGGPQPPSQNRGGLSGWALTGQAYPDSLPQSQATQHPCPDLEVHWGSDAKGQHAGQGWNVSLLWLAGDSGPPGSGVHEGMYGDYHTSTDLRLLEEPPELDTMPPVGEKLSSLFASNLGVRRGLDTLG